MKAGIYFFFNLNVLRIKSVEVSIVLQRNNIRTLQAEETTAVLCSGFGDISFDPGHSYQEAGYLIL